VRRLGRFIAALTLLSLPLGACADLKFWRRPPALRLHPVEWQALPGWHDDDTRPALDALTRSCAAIARRADDAAMGGGAATNGVLFFGRVADWKPACQALAAADLSTPDSARTFLESQFVPLRATNRRRRDGLFTGYYEAEAVGSLAHRDVYQTPLVKRPSDLVTADLGQFRQRLKGLSITGRVADGRFVPYPTRAEIDAGALDAEALALVWLSDPVDAFYIHIQGSGRIKLDDGTSLRVGYDGQNGRPYTAIGRVLLEEGALAQGNVSMQTIRAWLAAHPDEIRRVLEADASYIFFKEFPIDDPALGPPGAQQVPLTPRRSLAVDRNFYALGVPMWLDTSLPADAAQPPATPGAPFRRLMIAQDTGGAIRGPVRGDVFFGFGVEATELAGRMKQKGRLHVLLPKALADRLVHASGH
jgi:membrane-bound lytic murein transglycosylase A